MINDSDTAEMITLKNRVTALESLVRNQEYRINTHKHNLADETAEIGSGNVVYIGKVLGAGTASTPFPTGWTSAQTATGRYTITHNLKRTDYVVVGNSSTTTVLYFSNNTSTAFDVRSIDTVAGHTFTDADFYFALIIQ